MRVPLVISILFFAALAGLWQIYMPRPTEAQDPIAWQDQLPDSYMTQVTLSKYDEQGQLSQTLQANKVTHTNQENAYRYDHPTITWLKSQQQWKLQALHGVSRDGKDNIDLWDNVLLKHWQNSKQPDTTATTSSLHVQSNTQSVNTDKPVRITHPGIVITAKGMQGDMKTGELKTLAQTKTLYNPKID